MTLFGIGLGGVALLEEMCHWGAGLQISKASCHLKLTLPFLLEMQGKFFFSFDAAAT